MTSDNATQSFPYYAEPKRKVHLYHDQKGAAWGLTMPGGSKKKFANTLCKMNSDVPASHITRDPKAVTCKICLRDHRFPRFRPVPEIIRVVRVLEYVGERHALERVLSQNAVKGYRDFGGIIVREAILGQFPEKVG